MQFRLFALIIIITCTVIATPADAATLWHEGTFRDLPEIKGDFVEFVAQLPHPTTFTYGRVSSARAQHFNEFIDGLLAAIEQGLEDGMPDWCAVKDKAATAGYALVRFYDTRTGRWFLYAY